MYWKDWDTLSLHFLFCAFVIIAASVSVLDTSSTVPWAWWLKKEIECTEAPVIVASIILIILYILITFLYWLWGNYKGPFWVLKSYSGCGVKNPYKSCYLYFFCHSLCVCVAYLKQAVDFCLLCMQSFICTAVKPLPSCDSTMSVLPVIILCFHQICVSTVLLLVG